MAGINRITLNMGNGFSSIYTKRTCLDNSELYITSKLDKLYEQTILNNTNMHNTKRNLRKMVEGNRLDETF